MHHKTFQAVKRTSKLDPSKLYTFIASLNLFESKPVDTTKRKKNITTF